MWLILWTRVSPSATIPASTRAAPARKSVDETGAPYMLHGDYASVVYTYDHFGNVLTQAYYGMEGEPVIEM